MFKKLYLFAGACLLTGCFDIIQQDPQTVKNLRASVAHERAMIDRLKPFVDGGTSPSAKELKGALARHEAELLRLESWLIMENAKKEGPPPPIEPSTTPIVSE